MFLLGISVHVYSWWRLPFFSFRFPNLVNMQVKMERKHGCMLYMYMSPERKNVICTTFICTFLVILDDDELYTYLTCINLHMCPYYTYSLYRYFFKEKGKTKEAYHIYDSSNLSFSFEGKLFWFFLFLLSWRWWKEKSESDNISRCTVQM